MRNTFVVWVICFGFAVYTLSYETFKFDLMQFSKPPELQFSSSSTPFGNLLEAEPNFPDDMNYSSFLAWHPDGKNYSALLASNNSTNSTWLSTYFPDFCADW